jgi:NAD(P)H-dependent flavin oxidoreductase YrpB (nitropropane dioxygenase family)
MKTPICEMLGVEFPLLAFTHCRDVVVAVTNAGGFGVLGAIAHPPEVLERELGWIDERVGGRPYGIDLIVPEKFEGKGEPVDNEALLARVPEAHWRFLDRLFEKYGLERPRHGGEFSTGAVMFSDENVERLLEVAFSHPIRLIANALGVPPRFMVDRAKAEGVPIAALVGAREHAVRQVEAGVDVIIAQGYEAGGHTGEVATMVLVPEVIEAVASIRAVPVLAAGGIVTGRQMAAALALGAAGVWTGSVWLTTDEAETIPVVKEKMLRASSRDTRRSRVRTGKPARQLVSAWHEEWEGRESPGPLPMPLMSMVAEDAMHRINDAAEGGHEGAKQLATYFVGQGVGLMTTAKPAADVVYDFMSEFASAVERLQTLASEEATL